MNSQEAKEALQSISDKTISLIYQCERLNVLEEDIEILAFQIESVIIELMDIHSLAKTALKRFEISDEMDQY